MKHFAQMRRWIFEDMAVGESIRASFASRARAMVRYLHRTTDMRFLVVAKNDRAVVTRYPDGTDMDEVKRLLS